MDGRTRERLRRGGIGTATSLALAVGFAWMAWDEARIAQEPILGEMAWLDASHFTFAQFRDGKLSREDWQAPGFRQAPFHGMNPNAAKWVAGLALQLGGYELERPVYLRSGGKHKHYRMMSHEERAVANRAYMPFVVQLRTLVLWVSPACAVLLFWLVRSVAGVGAAILAYAAFLSTALIRDQQLRVLMDFFLMFASLSALWVAIVFARQWERSRPDRTIGPHVARILVLGALLGIAASTKPNGAAVAIVCALVGLALQGAGTFRVWGSWRPLAVMFATGATSLVTFVAINPQYWGNPVQRAVFYLRLWSQNTAEQQAYFAKGALLTADDKIGHVLQASVAGAGPLGALWTWLPPLLAGAGLVIVVLRAVPRSNAPGSNGADRTGYLFLAVWSVLIAGSTIAWIPIDWNRYYLPLIPAACALQAVALAALTAPLLRRLPRTRPAGSRVP
ncbi:MAG: hypothetical protein O7A09_00010 [Proteobacteria bacterium]|nr:hypothetical protein [Pseudomonadota bacterium]